jgi:hypothetical protein
MGESSVLLTKSKLMGGDSKESPVKMGKSRVMSKSVVVAKN